MTFAAILIVSVLMLSGAIRLLWRSLGARADLRDHPGTTRQQEYLLRKAITDLRGCLLLGLLAALNLTLLGAH